MHYTVPYYSPLGAGSSGGGSSIASCIFFTARRRDGRIFQPRPCQNWVCRIVSFHIVCVVLVSPVNPRPSILDLTSDSPLALIRKHSCCALHRLDRVQMQHAAPREGSLRRVRDKRERLASSWVCRWVCNIIADHASQRVEAMLAILAQLHSYTAFRLW